MVWTVAIFIEIFFCFEALTTNTVKASICFFVYVVVFIAGVSAMLGNMVMTRV